MLVRGGGDVLEHGLVTHICYELGFNNVANFNRRFLDIKGMTPSDFRKQSLTRFRGAA